MNSLLRAIERQWEHPAASHADELLMAILERLEHMSDQIAPIAKSITDGLASLNETIALAQTTAEALAPSPADVSALQGVADGLNTANTTLQAWIKNNSPAAAPGGGTFGTGTFSVSPSDVVIPLGSTASVALSFSGGTGPITASGLMPGVTFDGANLVPDGSQTVVSTSVEFSDFSSPALTANATVAVQ